MNIPTRDLKNVVADTIENIYEEFDAKIDRANALDKAGVIVGSMKYGIGGFETIRMREHDFNPPLCKECK